MAIQTRLIVWETGDLWSVALRWQTGLRHGEIQHAASLREVGDLLREAPASLAFLEATSTTAEGVWRFLWESARTTPRPRIVVATPAETRGLADFFREVGALWVVRSPRRLDRLRPWLAPAPVDPNREDVLGDFPGTDAIWERLPWNTPFPK